MKTSFKTALRLIALIAAAFASAWVAVRAAEVVEARNGAVLRAALDAGGHDWVSVDTDGLIVGLRGIAPDEAARFRALSAAGEVVNPASLRDRTEVREASAMHAPEFRLELLRRGEHVTAAGLIPGALADASALQASIGAALPGAAIVNLLSAVPEAPPPGWGAAVDTALAALLELEAVRVELHGRGLRVSGMASDRATVSAIQARLEAGLPDTFGLDLDLALPRPVISPFLTRARIDAAGARLESCAASDPAGRRRILAAARGLGVAEDADCILALGAPGPEWDNLVADGVTVLADLGAGVLTVSDLTVTLSPGPDVAPDALTRAVGRLQSTLPESYLLQVPADQVEIGRDAEISFTVTRSPEGVTLARGPVGDAAARRLVETFSHARLSDGLLHLSLHSGARVPEGWSVRVLAALDAISELESGRVRVGPAVITVRGETGDPEAAARIAAQLTETLGPSEPLQLDITYSERLDPVASVPTPESCLKRVDAIQAVSKIAFGPGETELDTDALQIVQRIAEVLRDCNDVDMEITGHTDSQGSAEMNRSLSQARAEAVLNALIADRVLASTLSAVGYGEARPVADNEIAEGREANRRIEFRLRFPLQGPEAPLDAIGNTGDEGGASAEAGNGIGQE